MRIGNLKPLTSRLFTLATMCAAAIVFASQAHAATLLFDFGMESYDTPGNWNNISTDTTTSTGGPGIRIANAIDSDGNATLVSLNITQDFVITGGADVANNNGVNASNIYPATAQRDYFYFSRDNSSPYPQIRLENLTVGETYDLTFFGSISTGLNRSLTVTIDGYDPKTLTVNNNTDQTISILNVAPDANGYITIDFSTTTSYAYLGVIEVQGNFSPIPEPSSMMLLGGSSLILLLKRRRS